MWFAQPSLRPLGSKTDAAGGFPEPYCQRQVLDQTWWRRCPHAHYCFIVSRNVRKLYHPTHLYVQEVYQFRHMLNVAEVVDNLQTLFNLLVAHLSSRHQ